jgi:hypothetical protein
MLLPCPFKRPESLTFCIGQVFAQYGILISTSSISIDLNGFEIVGWACVGATADCTPFANLGVGIRSDDVAKHYGISVYNGTTAGMGGLATFVGENSEVHHVRARWNGLGGIGGASGSMFSHNTAIENDGYGLGGNACAGLVCP